MEVKYGLFVSDQITVTLKDILLLLMGREVKPKNGGTSLRMKNFRRLTWK